ncbi:MAG: hypothetical protein AAGD00_09665 [Planctomycetota bacterium]
MTKASTLRAFSGSALAACLIATSGAALHLTAADASADVRTFRSTKKVPTKPQRESETNRSASRTNDSRRQRPPRDADDDYNEESIEARKRQQEEEEKKEQGAGDPGSQPDPRPEPDAQPDPVGPTGPQIVTSLNSNGLYVNIEENGSLQKVLVKPNGADLWKPRPNSDYHNVEPSVRMFSNDDGFDLRYTFVNDTNDVANLGHIQIPGIRFGEVLETHMLDYDGREVELDLDGRRFYFGPRRKWPDGFGLYSPVSVIREGDTRIGMSIQYDAREYEHVVAVRLTVPGSGLQNSGLNWQVDFELNPEDGDFAPEGLLQPGESRTYTVSFRVQTDAENEQWVEVLEPYKDYFRSTYGGVQYEVDRRPVRSIAMAQKTRLSPNNPRGFTPERSRLDDLGWSHAVDRMDEFTDEGFSRFIIRKPTGLYFNNQTNNFPYQMASAWDDIPRARQTEHLLKNFAARNDVEVGLWWGNAAKVMTEWDTPDHQIFDIDVPELHDAARAEAVAAFRVGSEVIGMDAVLLADHWDLYEWFQEMRSMNPDVRLIMEPFGPDFLNTLAGNYVFAVRGTDEGRLGQLQVFQELELANYLNPGQETWAQVRGEELAERHGYADASDVPRQMIIDEIVRVAELGYIPVIHDDVDFDPAFVAVDPNANDD